MKQLKKTYSLQTVITVSLIAIVLGYFAANLYHFGSLVGGFSVEETEINAVTTGDGNVKMCTYNQRYCPRVKTIRGNGKVSQPNVNCTTKIVKQPC